ncbi:MAG: RAD55 family ATPase [Thermoplasmataceae archaeon]
MEGEKVEVQDGSLSSLIKMREKLIQDMMECKKLLDDLNSRISENISSIGKATPPPDNNEESKTPIGISKLDLLLNGGVPSPSNLIVKGAPYSSKFVISSSFIANSLSSGYPVIVFLIDRDWNSFNLDLARIGFSADPFLSNGMLTILDAFSQSVQIEPREKRLMQIDSPSNVSNFLKAADQQCTKLKNSFGSYRCVVISLTGWIASTDQKIFSRAIQHFTHRRKMDGATGIYLLDGGIYPDALYEEINYFMDGSIELTLQGNTEYLRVRGIPDVRTREWVDVRPNGNSIELGSFNIKRVK